MVVMNPWTKLVQNISSKLAFFPPSPTYTVLEHNDGTGELYIQPKYSELPRVLSCVVKRLKTKKRRGGGGGEEIIAAFIPYVPKNSTDHASTTILYSHGNAVDLGQLMPFYKDLARALRVNVMAYDYSGYGCSTGTPTVQNTQADIEAVYSALVTDFGFLPKDIILYGQSVGSGPSAWLGANAKGLAGVVMHTPLLSGIRVLNPNLKWWPSWADVYPNHLLVPKIEAPVLILHGTEDEVIHISHGMRMHDLCQRKVEPLWAIGYNHQNLELCPQYLPRLRKFIKELNDPPPPTPTDGTPSTPKPIGSTPIPIPIRPATAPPSTPPDNSSRPSTPHTSTDPSQAPLPSSTPTATASQPTTPTVSPGATAASPSKPTLAIPSPSPKTLTVQADGVSGAVSATATGAAQPPARRLSLSGDKPRPLVPYKTLGLPPE